MGYSGIKLIKNQPVDSILCDYYNGLSGGGVIYFSFYPPPKIIFWTWDFILVRILMVILYFSVPVFLIWYTFIKQEYFKGGLILGVWSLCISLMGCWIWLFAYMNCTHGR